MDGLNALMPRYLAARQRGRSATEALLDAVESVFDGEEQTLILTFLTGEQDALFGAGSGLEFRRTVIRSLESAWNETVERANPTPGFVVRSIQPRGSGYVEFVEAIATSSMVCTTYYEAAAEGSQATCSLLLGEARDLILGASKAALTGPGRTLRLNRARQILVLLRNKAASRREFEAAAQAAWCDELLNALPR